MPKCKHADGFDMHDSATCYDCGVPVDDAYDQAAEDVAELLALIEAHNAAPCPQVFKIELPAKYREGLDDDSGN